jgi:hypothetical protein
MYDNWWTTMISLMVSMIMMTDTDIYDDYDIDGIDTTTNNNNYNNNDDDDDFYVIELHFKIKG